MGLSRPWQQAAWALVALLIVSTTETFAADYTLFNPTPADKLRPLNSDRPTQTTGAFTLDPGHVQLESSFVEYTRDDSGDPGIQQFSILPTDFRIGLTSHVEADILIEPAILQRQSSNGHHTHTDSFGDTTAQLKINLIGDDDGPLCLTLVPYVIAPTATQSSGIGTGYVQGGLALPAQVKLPKDFLLQGEFEIEADRSDDNVRYGETFVESILVTRSFGPFGPYVELFNAIPRQLGHSNQMYVDSGTSIQINDNLQLDVGVNVGVSTASRGYTILTGITVRR